jgi:hypothetical protein
MPIYLVLVIGRSFLEGLSSTLKTYSTRGALLYCVGLPDKFPWGPLLVNTLKDEGRFLYRPIHEVTLSEIWFV